MLYLLRIETVDNENKTYAYFTVSDCTFSPTSKKWHIIDTLYSDGFFVETKKMITCEGKITSSKFRDKVYSNKYTNPCLLVVEDEIGQNTGYEHRCSKVKFAYTHSDALKCEFIVEASGRQFKADDEFYHAVNSTFENN